MTGWISIGEGARRPVKVTTVSEAALEYAREELGWDKAEVEGVPIVREGVALALMRKWARGPRFALRLEVPPLGVATWVVTDEGEPEDFYRHEALIRGEAASTAAARRLARQHARL